MAEDVIYKICGRDEWHKAAARGCFGGNGDDERDGFIHFSTAAQVRETAAKHFARREDLVLIAVRAGALSDALEWEVSRGGDKFPHLYGELPLSAVIETRDLALGAGGVHIFPKGLA